MKTKKAVLIAILPISLLVFLLLNSSCDPICEGYLRVINPIPDTTLVVGDTLFIDLTDPPVFKSSEDRIDYWYNVLDGNFYSDLSIYTGYNKEDKIDSLQIIGRSPGKSIVKLIGVSDCLENSTTFTVNVIER